MNPELFIRQAALYNAKKFGKANEKAVLGGALKEFPELRKDIASTQKLVKSIVDEINALDNDALQQEISKLPEKTKEAPKEKTLKPLKNAEQGKVVMRFAPSPSGPMHIGHAYLCTLNAAYAKKYDGTFILRIEDTNPENIYEPAYEMLHADCAFLTDGPDMEIIQSMRLGTYYDYAEKLVSGDGAYVCTCDSDSFRTLVNKKEACPCRELGVEEHRQRYAKMFSSYKPGEAVLRAKTDVTHKNPAMRDFPLMRINEHPHPRTGTEHRVWPLMNLAVTCDDIDFGVTHIIRAKDHRDNAKRQEHIYNFFDKPIPETMFVGRINFTDMRVSASQTKKEIQEGKYTGWDDIRLPFVRPLMNRGYQPGAFLKWSIEVGISETDKTVDQKTYFTSLNAYNKQIIDSWATRYFFMKDPVRIDVLNTEEKTVVLKKHPDDPNAGTREFKTGSAYWIEREDYEQLDNGLHRLMDNLNFTKEGPGFVFHSYDYPTYKASGKKIMHWLPIVDDLVKVRIKMPDNTEVNGLAEPSLVTIEKDCMGIPGWMVQFERFGFCSYRGKVGDTYVFWYAHR